MLALATGWTPDVLADLPQRFRAACHWVEYVRAIAGPEGLPSTDIPAGVSAAAKLDALTRNADVLRQRSLLYPEDDDG